MLVALAATAPDAVRADPVGRWARYDVSTPPGVHPPLDRIVLAVPAREAHEGRDHVWFQFEAFSGPDRLWAVAMLVPSLDFLSAGGGEPGAARYVLFPGDRRPLEWVRRRTGEPVLPRFDFAGRLLPRSDSWNRPPEFPFETGRLFGREMIRGASGNDAELLPVNRALRIELEDEILIGTSRHFRDDGTAAARGADYRYVPLGGDDFRTMIDAGMNVFEVTQTQIDHVLEEPVFFLLKGGYRKRPDFLYRSNFLGAVQYMDEPAVRAVQQRLFAEVATPAEAATLLVEITRGRLAGDGKYGSRMFDRLLRRDGYDLGPGTVPQAGIPAWEAFAGTAWYQLEAGAAGFCHESRIQPERFATIVEDAVGVAFPTDPAMCIDFYLSLFTGAARRFDQPWGVSIYGQTDAGAAEMLFPRAYDRGATYFWFWTSDRGHHVPYERQLRLARQLRSYAGNRSRPSPAALTASASTALALPWGYVLDDFSFVPSAGNRRPGLWGSPKLALGKRNAAGATYGEVLAAGMREAARLLRAGERFDIVFVRDDEDVPGYGRVVRVRETAEVSVTR